MGIRAAITAEQRNADVVRRYLRVFETFAVEELAFLLHRSVIVHEGGTTVRGNPLGVGGGPDPGAGGLPDRGRRPVAARDRVIVACT